MTRRLIDNEDPDRLYTVTGGRSRPAEDIFDLVTLIVSGCDPSPGMQSEHAKILRLCREPVAVVELSSDLGLPVSVVKILLGDLLDMGKITARHPSSTRIEAPIPAPDFLKQVLVGLRNI
ncbi:DUF742 domain-containing protein [Saccharopolyspora phatthalungensis]|uniref:DUF742 domain-containing protein n=1 Tax=Saccharopolyspora phatthalungensis TaxID=664693 RepID=A0A840QA13_9PSEU|nr:DUF742 domain-containing protein [Saccharopolyspora phatthalungensis]MBB5156581.1 hypothetical protein [Saccharopolyspora phatthalungensis]